MGDWTLAAAQQAAMESLEAEGGTLAQRGDEAIALAAGDFPRSTYSGAYVATLLVKGGWATLYGFSGYNSKTSAQFIQVFNLGSTVALATGAVPVIVISVPAASNFSFDAGIHGRRFSRGIVIANSSTGPTYTAGSADCWFDVQYV